MENLLSSVQKSKRELWIDILRGGGILLVVLLHSNPPFNKIVGGFLIPLFFIITGFLWKKKRIQQYLHKYITPYFILCAINFLLYSAMLLVKKKEIPICKYILGILYSRGTTEWMPNCSPLWYLTSLFCSTIIFGLIQEINRRSIKTILVVASGFLSAFLSYAEFFKLPWNIDTALMGVVFLYFGYNLRQLKMLEKVKALSLFTRILMLTVIGIIGIISIICNPVKSVNFDGNRYGNVFLMIIGALAICFVLFYFCYRIPWQGMIGKSIAWFGRHTIFIMGFDYFTGSISREILGKLDLENWATVFTVKIIILTVLCLAWNYLISRLNIKKNTYLNL